MTGFPVSRFLAPVVGVVLALTLPPLTTALAQETIVFAVLGDYGDGSSAEASVASEVNGWAADLIITAGDNRYGSSSFDTTVGQFYCGHLSDVALGSHCAGGDSPSNAFFPSPGNHDYTDGGGISEYLNYFTLPGSGTSGSERYYDFVEGPVHFFAIDSHGALTNAGDMAAQQAWLQQQLAASTAPWQVVFFHHAAYSSSPSHGSNPAMQWPFAAWGADAVIAGHDHTYERISANGIPYFVNGLGGRSIYSFGPPIAGSEFRYNDDYGAMRVTADSAEMTFEFVNTAGVVIDSYILLPSDSVKVSARIAGGGDDVEERLSDGFVYSDSSDLELGDDPAFNGAQTLGLRFTALDIPPGASVVSAYLEFTVDETGSTTTEVEIAAEASDDAPAFTATNYDVTGRSLTAAFVPWTIPAWSAVGAPQRSPELAAVIQEVVERPGWSSGNDLVFVISGTGTRTAEAYEGVAAAAPLLFVEYTVPPPSNQAPTANFSYSTTDLTAYFSDTSTDNDGSVVAWTWDFGDGAGSSAQNPSHSYAAAGSYSVSLNVTDDDGDGDGIAKTVTVTAPTGPPAAPSDLVATVTTSGKGKNKSKTVTLAWTDNAGNEDSFVIERCQEEGKGKNKTCVFAEHASVGADVTGFAEDAGSGSFKYRVKARNAEGDSGYSNEVKI